MGYLAISAPFTTARYEVLSNLSQGVGYLATSAHLPQQGMGYLATLARVWDILQPLLIYHSKVWGTSQPLLHLPQQSMGYLETSAPFTTAMYGLLSILCINSQSQSAYLKHKSVDQ